MDDSGPMPGTRPATGRGALSRRAALVGVGAAMGGALAGPAWAQQAARRAPLTVVSTIAMIGDVVRQIGGDRLRAETLLGAGVDPHLYRATRDDIARLLRADVIFYNGLVLEGKMVDALVRVARTGKPVFAVTELLPQDKLIEPEGENGLYDPHVWMDVRLWSQAAGFIAERLIEIDRPGAASYRRNLAALQATMAELDTYAERAIATIPERQRVLVTAHDAFNYFERRYAIEVIGIQGLSTEGEAGVRRIQDLVDRLVASSIPAVFVESSVSDRNIRALVEGAGSRGHRVVVGGELFSDAMGEPGSYEGTYIGMIDHNVTTIARALGGNVPERGFQNRLGTRA